MKRKFLVVLAILAVACWVVPASADSYFLTSSNFVAGTGPFAEVDVVINSLTSATITETGLGDYAFHGPIGIGFNFATGVTATPEDTSVVNPTPSARHMDGYGDFNTVFPMADVSWAAATQGPVVFDVTGTGFTTDANLFNGTFFCDTMGSISSGGTNTGFVDTATAVPIPPSALLFGSGLLGLVGIGWRKRG